MPEENSPRRKKGQLHDAVFKAFFSNAEIAKNYLLHYTTADVHRHIDFTYFEKSNTAFINGRFGISFADIVYETRLANAGTAAKIMFLFEHKSYLPTQAVQLQLLDYFLQIWEDDLKNKRPLSFIIPIIVYHGKRSWKRRSLAEYFPGIPENWRLFIPDFSYLLTDLSQTSSESIRSRVETEYLKNLFLTLKFVHDAGLIKENWQEIFTFEVLELTDDRKAILLQTLTIYVFKVLDMTHKEFHTLTKKLPEPTREWINAIPEVLVEDWKKEGLEKGLKEGLKEGLKKGLNEGRKEGRKEGLIEGRKEGIKEGKKEGFVEGRKEGQAKTLKAFVIKLIQKFPDWSDAEVAEFASVSVDYVQQLREALEKKR